MAADASDVLLGGLDSLTKDPNATEDYSESTSLAIADAKVLAKAGKFLEAVNTLLVVEKRARQASDAISVSKLACEVLQVCKDLGEWSELNNYVTLLAKKRGQLKRAVIDMVQLCITWIDNEGLAMDVKMPFIDTLCRVTQRKIFVEVERARLLRTLAYIKEEEGNITEAASILEGVQVETFGAMERREKTEYILEQMRYVLIREDFIRCQIISRKINPKLLEAEDFQDLKLKYYEYMLRYHLHESEYLEVAKAYRCVFNTPKVQADPTLWKAALECFLIYLVLSPFGNEQSDLLNKTFVSETKKLNELSSLKQLVTDFLASKLVKWPLEYEADLKLMTPFASPIHTGGDERWSKLRIRVLQHDIKALSTYYIRMRLSRIGELLSMTVDETETHIAELVTSGYILAKIDRPAGIVVFGGRKDEKSILDDWARNIAKVLDLVEESGHFVEKERMLHAAKAKKIQALQRASAG